MTSFRRILKDYQESGAMNALVNVHAAVDEQTFLTKTGDLLQVVRVEGVDANCLDPGELDSIARRFETAVRTFDERFRIYQYLVKSDHAPIPHRPCAEPVVEKAIASHIAHLQSQPAPLCAFAVYVVIVYEGWRPTVARPSSSRKSPRASLAQALSVSKTLAVLEDGIDRACETLARQVLSFTTQLRETVSPEILDKQRVFRFLRELLNYPPRKAQAVRLACDSFVDFQACDSALECHRDHLRLDEDYVQVLTLKTAPAHTFAHLLKGLERIPGRYFLVSEWNRESNLGMRRLIQSKRRHFHNVKSSMANYFGSSSQNGPRDMLVDDGAVALVADLGGCLEELEMNGRYFGQFSLTIVLYGGDLASLRRAAADCIKVFGTHDAHLTEERYNLLNAWLSALPGNSAYNLRRLWISNTNYADLAFLFAPREGEPHNAHLDTEYLGVLETEEGAPYFLNLHVRDNAHSLILGAPGSGKSFLINFLLTHLQKYAPLTYVFDLGGSYETLTRVVNGSYLPVGLESRSFAINPFCLPATHENLHFLFSFCKVLIESGGYRMSDPDDRDLVEQIESLYAVEPEQRRLWTLSNILNRQLRVHLQKWVQGGAYGALFDNVADTLTFARFQVFDFEDLDKCPDVMEPLLFYVLHRANAAIYDPALAGTFKAFVMDEAWRFFRHPTIRRYLLAALKTWRKKNAAMILATQSVDDLVRSEMLAPIAESCATQMFLAIPGMDPQVYRDIFHLNDAEAAWIARLVPKQQILVKQPGFAKVVSLNVDRRSYWLYTNSPFDNVKKRQAFERYGVAEGLEILAGRHGDQGA